MNALGPAWPQLVVTAEVAAAMRVEGLTTATSLLFSGGIGVCAALQQWWLAIGATLLAC